MARENKRIERERAAVRLQRRFRAHRVKRAAEEVAAAEAEVQATEAELRNVAASVIQYYARCWLGKLHNNRLRHKVPLPISSAMN